MEVLYVIVPLAVAFAGGALMTYIWGVRSGQFDDMTTPAHQILVDDTDHTDQAGAGASGRE